MEVQECFSSPEILEAQCDLAPYCGATPNRLHCPFGIGGPIFEVVQDIFVECVINSLLGSTNSLCTMPRLSKNNSHPGSAHACFFQMRTLCVPFRTFPFGLGIVVEHL